MKRDLYAEVSARIVAELEAGAAPWVKPWSATPGANTPCNAVSNRPYSGCNVVLLWMAQTAGYRTPRFLTVQGRVIERVMCTTRVYQSGRQKPITINDLLILLGFLCRWRRGRDSRPMTAETPKTP